MKQQKQGRSIIHFVWLAVIFTMVLATQALFAGENEIEFRGSITKIDKTSSTKATLKVALSAPASSSPDTTVLVDDLTKIVGQGDVALTLDDLKLGQFIEVRGVFTSKGIDAIKIEVEAENESKDEFRIRGTIDNVVVNSGVATLTIGGVSIIANGATRIQRRGASGALTLADLAVNQLVDVQGTIQNGQLMASRIEIGQKMQEEAELEFRGTITKIDGNVITIQISKQPPVSVLVNKTDQTRVEGTLAVGVDVEVKAVMAKDFSIDALKIEVAGAAEKENESGDDNGGAGNGGTSGGGNGGGGTSGGNSAPQSVERQIRLNPTTAAPKEAEGEAELEFESEQGTVQQKLKVKAENLLPNITHTVQVSFGGGFGSVGTFMTDNRGRGEMELRCGASCAIFPTGKDVRDITAVQVLNGATIVLKGTF